jgi:hypothetical protein
MVKAKQNRSFEGFQAPVTVARAYGHSSSREFKQDDLTILSYEMHRIAGIAYGGLMD